ncbi:hypothetical protein [Neisseria sicca]|nr:hypothetical protein [Neisseria sicca]
MISEQASHSEKRSAMMPDKIRIQNNIGHQCPTCRKGEIRI